MSTPVLSRRARPRRARFSARSRCDATAMSHPAVTAFVETPDPDTDARLTEHRLDPPLERSSEPGVETPRGTVGRGQLSVGLLEAAASALDDSSGPRSSTSPAVMTPGLVPKPELSSSRKLPSGQPLLAAFGGSATMSLQTFDRVTNERVATQSTTSMRFMETGLAFIAIAVALLLNLGR